jgi:phage-related minor tail protein
MDDRLVLDRIGALVEEEHTLERQATGEGLDQDQQARLEQLEVQLDQCWDLLRQRRARRDAGLDPEDAQVRPEGTVEGYLQ